MRIAETSDILQLLMLWQKCFDDSEEMISLFMRKRFPDSFVLVAEEDGKIVSALYLISSNINNNGVIFPAHYVYSAATLPEYRGRGLMSSLIEFSFEVSRKNKAGYSFLLPSGTSSASFYEKFGYKNAFFKKTASFESGKIGLKRIKTNEITPEEMLEISKEYFKKDKFSLLWSEDDYEYLLKDTKIAKGFAAGFSYGGNRGYVVALPKENRVEIEEIICEKSALPFVLAAVKYNLPANEYVVRTKANSLLFDSEIKPFGMLKTINGRTLSKNILPYLSLAFS